jgi:hypothetical protein
MLSGTLVVREVLLLPLGPPVGKLIEGDDGDDDDEGPTLPPGGGVVEGLF